MTTTKVVTVRLPAEEARKAEILARTDGISVNEVFRTALEHYVELKKADPEFVARARAMIAADAAFVQALR